MSNRGKYHDLKVIMFSKRVSQERLAKELHITAQAINSKLNGRSDFTIPEAEKIIEHLEIDNPTPVFFKSMLRGTQV